MPSTTEIEQLLNTLEEERGKFTKADNKKMSAMVNELVRLGVYPQTPFMSKHNRTYLDMVQFYGARWHEYDGVTTCPHCSFDLRSEQGPPFSVAIGVEVRGLYDGVAYYECPSCSGNWSRKGTPLSKKQALSMRNTDIFRI